MKRILSITGRPCDELTRFFEELTDTPLADKIPGKVLREDYTFVSSDEESLDIQVVKVLYDMPADVHLASRLRSIGADVIHILNTFEETSHIDEMKMMIARREAHIIIPHRQKLSPEIFEILKL